MSDEMSATGVEGTPVAGGADTGITGTVVTQEQTQTDTAAAEQGTQEQPAKQQDQQAQLDKAFAARLKQAQEKWERDNSRYLQAGRELEQRGYNLEALQTQARQQSVSELVQQGWPLQAAQQYIQEQERVATAEHRAHEAALQAEAARLAVKFGKDFDPGSVMAFAQQRAEEMGEALTLETAYMIMSHENAQRNAEQKVLAALQAGQTKGTESGTKGAGQKSIADMSDAEIEAIAERVRRGEKVKF